ncbi:hypothetical protein SCLCIDRAFT_1208287 [Scleroderma citrinum Foug A]|uniref:Uncharacterized protein n=1 Tax=Scleroderma citrinum Foug A TaxID=1036808 RepID=A0A0C3EAL4_9AGAM|nr:hypothetical protein SCLCIDRAFT_1208287 [Scleroderma citrinum Foug A]
MKRADVDRRNELRVSRLKRVASNWQVTGSNSNATPLAAALRFKRSMACMEENNVLRVTIYVQS